MSLSDNAILGAHPYINLKGDMSVEECTAV